MNCPFCKEELNEISLRCGNCNRFIGKRRALELSREKLTFQEIITLHTFIERAEHHIGGSYFNDKSENMELSL